MGDVFSLDHTIITNYSRIAQLSPKTKKKLQALGTSTRTVGHLIRFATVNDGRRIPGLDLPFAERLILAAIESKQLKRPAIDAALQATRRLSAKQVRQIVEQVAAKKITLNDVPDIARLQPSGPLTVKDAKFLSPNAMGAKLRSKIKDANQAILMAKDNWHHFDQAQQAVLAMEIEMLHNQFVSTAQHIKQIK